MSAQIQPEIQPGIQPVVALSEHTAMNDCRVLTAREIFHVTHLEFELYATDCRTLFLKRLYKWKKLSPACIRKLDIIPFILQIRQEIWEKFGSSLKLSPSQVELLVNGHLAQWDVTLMYAILQHIKSPGQADEFQNAAIFELKRIEQQIYIRHQYKMYVDEFTSIHRRLIDVKHRLKFKISAEAETLSRYMFTLTTYNEALHIFSCMLTGIGLLGELNYQSGLYFLTKALETSSLSPETRKYFLHMRMINLHARKSQYPYFHQAVAKDALEILQICDVDQKANKVLYNYLAEKIGVEPYQAIEHYHKFSGGNPVELLGYICEIVLDSVSNMKADDKKEKLEKAARGLSDKANVHKHILAFKQMAEDGCAIGKFAYCTSALVYFDEAINGCHDATVSKRLDSLLEIANEETHPVVIGNRSSKAHNCRVVFCQFVIGLLHQTGYHLELNLNAAELWYKKACILHGLSLAAFNLGYMYNNGGIGIPQNLELAKQYWKLAVAQGHTYAHSALAILHLKQFDIVQAKELVIKASRFRSDPEKIITGSLLPRLSNGTSHSWLSKINKLDKILDEKYEKPANLGIKGMTFMDRVKRAEIVGFQGNIKHFLDAITTQFKLMPTLLHEVYVANLNSNIILTDALPGKQFTPEEFIPAMDAVLADVKMIYSFVNSTLNFSIQDKTSICTMLHSILERSPTISFGLYLCQCYSMSVLNRITNVMRDILTLQEISPDVKTKAKFCLAIFGLFKGLPRPEPQQLISEVISEQSTNPLYKIAKMELFLGNGIPAMKEMLVDATAYLLRFQNQPTLQYLCADLHFKLAMKILGENKETEEFGGRELRLAIMGFQACITCSPVESPLYPLAAYGIAVAYIHLFECINPEKVNPEIVTKIHENMEAYHEDVVKFYKIGLQSEQHQLPYFPLTPAGKYLKFKVEVYINKKRETSNYLPHEELQLDEFNGAKCLYFSKPYLLSPLRIYHVTSFRHELKQRRESASVIKQAVVYERREVKEIQINYYKQFNENRLVLSTGYNSRVTFEGPNALIKLTVVEDISCEFTAIKVLAEDNNGNTVYVKVEPDACIWRVNTDLKLEFGTKIAVTNPTYVIDGCFGDNYISVGRKMSGGGKIILLEKVKDMCRFCGEPGATKACPNAECGYRYCGDECLENDVRFMNHELTC